MLTTNKIGMPLLSSNIQQKQNKSQNPTGLKLKTLDRDTVAFSGILSSLFGPKKPLPNVIKKELQELPGVVGEFMKQVNIMCNGSPEGLYQAKCRVSLIPKEQADLVHEELDRIVKMSDEELEKMKNRGITPKCLKKMITVALKPKVADGKFVTVRDGESIAQAIKRGEEEGIL